MVKFFSDFVYKYYYTQRLYNIDVKLARLTAANTARNIVHPIEVSNISIPFSQYNVVPTPSIAANAISVPFSDYDVVSTPSTAANSISSV